VNRDKIHAVIAFKEQVFDLKIESGKARHKDSESQLVSSQCLIRGRNYPIKKRQKQREAFEVN
jgi:hypothetical protein